MPDKKYPATRYHQQVTKTFSTPLARRTDVSRIQLGYRLVIDVGGGPSGRLDIVLCPYSSPGHPDEDLPLFPTAPVHLTLHAPAAMVYDVVQSTVFTAADEDSWEATGAVPARRAGTVLEESRPRERVFGEPRPAPVTLEVSVAFAFDPHDPAHPFMGRADITVTTAASGAEPYGIIARVEMYETLVAALDNGTRDVVQEQLADTMTVHLVPSFLVAPRAWFDDRAAGLAEMDDVLGRVSEKYARAKAAMGPLGRLDEVSGRARLEQVATQVAVEHLHADPVTFRPMLARLEVPVAQVRTLPPQRTS